MKTFRFRSVYILWLSGMVMHDYLNGIKYSLRTKRFTTDNPRVLYIGNTSSTVKKALDSGVMLNKATSQATILFPSGHRHEYICFQKGDALRTFKAEYAWLVIVFDKNNNIVAFGDEGDGDIDNDIFIGRSGACEYVKGHVEYHLNDTDMPLQPYLDN